jgi:hypothetical protein
VTNTENGDDDAPEERARRRWDEVADALEGANVLRRLVELARVPQANRSRFSNAVFDLVLDVWDNEYDRRSAASVVQQDETLARAIGSLQSARQAFADLDVEHRKLLWWPISEIETGIDRFLQWASGQEPEPTRRRAHRRGRRPGRVNWMFAAFVVKLRRAASAAGGRLGLQKNIKKGPLLEAIEIVAPHLPDGFVPKPLSASTLQRIISGR